ncbi:MAG: hypothetical protein COU33_04155 [Candidatus Magasanikbacteria bacterium CG10_big_fil_rev_8_21_14_0_10_43_6]|uniref:Phosphatidic acid phosphatase type 2/haloperoxidase domain-containing protein n=1 Tax=Candidatus Magasanikbacteria bacterium CG10_big_fil_rev_8_21_14_0_10_43_6 TaxID=1974650 RepID=A0A2M6W0K6_9BACT|nr:MAG: hypothetical protein COU33_04155 [Candidatus Magasanikbacteria bacterium CG10_big_fil_rev_8_21_14_0_10_43_6]
MKISWSHILFFKINRSIGGHPRRDAVMLFCAQTLIYVFVSVVLLWALMVLPPEPFKWFIQLIMTAGFFALLTSYSIALVWPHRRPSLEFPEIQQLLEPLGTWKSFPSDHTLVSFIFFSIPLFVGAPWYVLTLFFLFAVSISFARVYVGVHYPRDIVGGFVLALGYSLLACWLLGEVTQPLYVFFTDFFR